MSRAAVLGALALAVTWPSAQAQTSAQEALKQPIAESGLREQAEKIDSTEAAAIAAAPRAIAVNPRVPEPEPEPTPPTPKAKGPTEITALEATFDNRQHQAVFLKNVVVNDPEFSVICDKLTAFLKHDDDKAEAPKPEVKKAPVVKGEKDAEPKPGERRKGGLDRAIAEGHVVIKQAKVEADNSTSLSIGKGQRADYDADTGIIVLTGRPSVQQGINTCVATADDTVMTLNRDGRMHVTGAFRTIIADKAELQKKP